MEIQEVKDLVEEYKDLSYAQQKVADSLDELVMKAANQYAEIYRKHYKLADADNVPYDIDGCDYRRWRIGEFSWLHPGWVVEITWEEYYHGSDLDGTFGFPVELLYDDESLARLDELFAERVKARAAKAVLAQLEYDRKTYERLKAQFGGE